MYFGIPKATIILFDIVRLLAESQALGIRSIRQITCASRLIQLSPQNIASSCKQVDSSGKTYYYSYIQQKQATKNVYLQNQQATLLGTITKNPKVFSVLKTNLSMLNPTSGASGSHRPAIGGNRAALARGEWSVGSWHQSWKAEQPGGGRASERARSYPTNSRP